MLKACCDCIAGYSNGNRDRPDYEPAYGIRLNGDTQRAPPWPEPTKQNETMFVIPRQLKSGDRIDVSGHMRNDTRMFTVNLVTGNTSPDYANIACQIEVKFPASNENRLKIKIIHSGNLEEISGVYENIPATEWFEDTSFNFAFSMTENYEGPLLSIVNGDSFMDQIKLKHNLADIRFLTLDGDIEKVNSLNFQFA